MASHAQECPPRKKRERGTRDCYEKRILRLFNCRALCARQISLRMTGLRGILLTGDLVRCWLRCVWGLGGRGLLVVLEDAGDFAEEALFLLRVGVGVLRVC